MKNKKKKLLSSRAGETLEGCITGLTGWAGRADSLGRILVVGIRAGGDAGIEVEKFPQAAGSAVVRSDGAPVADGLVAVRAGF